METLRIWKQEKSTRVRVGSGTRLRYVLVTWNSGEINCLTDLV